MRRPRTKREPLTIHRLAKLEPHDMVRALDSGALDGELPECFPQRDRPQRELYEDLEEFSAEVWERGRLVGGAGH